MNKPHWQSSGNIIFLCQYYIVISDRQVGSFLAVFFLLLLVILLELHVKHWRKDWVSEKIYSKICVRGINFLAALPPFYLILCTFFIYSLPLPKWCTCSMARMGGVLWCVLPALRTWYYFRLCFSFSCFVFDLTLIKKSLTLNFYSFLHKFLLKIKITNSLLVTVIAEFTVKTTNSEKAICFLSLMSCSINKIKSHLLLACKNFVL